MQSNKYFIIYLKNQSHVILANATHRMWEMSREDMESTATSIQSIKEPLEGWTLEATQVSGARQVLWQVLVPQNSYE